jgi:hypothetical protein
MVGWTKTWQNKTWPKVHFAKVRLCIVLTQDDDKIVSFKVGLANLRIIFKCSLEIDYACVNTKL